MTDGNNRDYPKTTQRQTLGRQGEELACQFLQKKGFKILTAPYKNKIGEIDIIAELAEWLVFIEVKTRRNENFGCPAAAVTITKQHKIIMIAQAWLRQFNQFSRPIRFDVVAILWPEGQLAKINHIERAFTA